MNFRLVVVLFMRRGAVVTTLEDLWYGHISPNEQGSYWRSECKALPKLYNQNSDKLSAILNADEKETLEKMRDC